MTTVYKKIPDWFLSSRPTQFFEYEKDSFILDIEGDKDEAIVISTLLHGNECSGIYSLQSVLTKLVAKNQRPHRRLIIFIGNVVAAVMEKRVLENQVDYNRIWKNTPKEHVEKVEALESLLLGRRLFATVDLHNSTGRNPYYACVCNLNPHSLQLAALYGRTVVYFTNPDTTFTYRFADRAPSVTIEAGVSRSPEGLLKNIEFIESLLHIDHLPDRAPAPVDCVVYDSLCRIILPKDSSIGFGPDPTQDMLKGDLDFLFSADVDLLNFTEVEEGVVFGFRRSEELRFNAETDAFFSYEGQVIRVRKKFVPSLISTNESIIHQDCFGYIMKEV